MRQFFNQISLLLLFLSSFIFCFYVALPTELLPKISRFNFVWEEGFEPPTHGFQCLTLYLLYETFYIQVTVEVFKSPHYFSRQFNFSLEYEVVDMALRLHSTLR
jgi:hypothetical protein